jgi:hypothetical protein
LLAAAWNLLWAIQTEIKHPEMVDTPWEKLPKPAKTECEHRAYFSDYDIHYCDIDREICDNVNECPRENDYAEKI